MNNNNNNNSDVSSDNEGSSFNESLLSQSSASTFDSDIRSISSIYTTVRQIPPITYVGDNSPSAIFRRFARKCKSMMKIRGLPNLEEVMSELLMSDDKVRRGWHKLWYVYWHDRHCLDQKRIEDELYQCFDALINDGRGTMIGLDSISTLKDLLITSMRIASEPNFTMEIRVGLGGTKDSLNLRAPSYVIPPAHILEQLLILRERFPANQSQLGESIPTEMLINPPILTFFCACSASIKINKFDEKIANKNAHDLIEYFKRFIEHQYSNLTNYVRYEFDHETTCNEPLLTRIIKHYNSRYDHSIEQIKEQLIAKAIRRGGDKEGSIEYSSMHLIMAKDIIDKNVPLYLFDEHHHLQTDQIVLYDCIITIGGSVEEIFNQVRYAVRQAFMEESIRNNEENFHYSLSIRYLCKPGEKPVYYRDEPSDITVDHVKQGQVTISQLIEHKCKPIAQDLAIIREEMGRNLFKPFWNHIPNTQSNKTSSWRDIVLNLADLCLQVQAEHMKTEDRTCQCLIESSQLFEQVCAHYNLVDVLDANTRSILQTIVDTLTRCIGDSSGQTIELLRRKWKRTLSNSKIFEVLDHLLASIFLDLIRSILPQTN